MAPAAGGPPPGPGFGPTAGFAVAPEIADLAEAAARLAERELAPGARTAEAAGRWPTDVLEVIDAMALGGLDLPGSMGGAGAGALAKVAVLAALAGGDAGGLPAADQPGAAIGAVLACPDPDVAGRLAEAGLTRQAQAPLVVVDPDSPPRLEWAPGWPPLRWAWVLSGDHLRLVDVDAEPGGAVLAFAASGAVTGRLEGASTVGAWDLPVGAGLAVRGRARLWAAAVAVGVARAAFAATIAYTTERVVFGRPVAHHQGNAFELAVASARLHGADLALRDAAARFDAGDPDAGFWATQAWIETMDAAATVTDQGIQFLGGHGFLMDHLAEKRFREVRMLALLWGGRDSAEADAAAVALDVGDPVFSGGGRR